MSLESKGLIQTEIDWFEKRASTSTPVFNSEVSKNGRFIILSSDNGQESYSFGRREFQIIKILCSHPLSDKQLASYFGTSRQTIKNQITRISHKLDLKDETSEFGTRDKLPQKLLSIGALRYVPIIDVDTTNNFYVRNGADLYVDRMLEGVKRKKMKNLLQRRTFTEKQIESFVQEIQKSNNQMIMGILMNVGRKTIQEKDRSALIKTIRALRRLISSDLSMTPNKVKMIIGIIDKMEEMIFETKNRLATKNNFLKRGVIFTA